MKNILICFLTATLLFSSCKKDEPDPGVTPAMARDTLYYIMKQWYYWYNLMPSVTKENYADPYLLLEAMRYKPVDRWSFVADYDEFNAEMQGTFVGHGIRVGLDESQKARIALIYNNSPLYSKGVRRGWILKTVNTRDIAQILIAEDDEAYNEAFGPGKAGITNNFVFQDPDGNDVTISSTKSTFTINSVLLYDTLHLKTGITGHLVFESFIEPSAAELRTAFKFFKDNNVKDLILDLRYNSGGYLEIAQYLASYILGNVAQGTLFAKLQYNNRNQDENVSYPFVSTQYPLSLSRLAVISTRFTASASEAVMNGLKPFMEVISIGDTTNGKPTGMNGWDCGKKYYFWPITFKMVNSADQGDYFEGIYPSVIASDDIRFDFNNRNEESLREAIQYLETGTLPGKGPDKFSRSVQFSEKPSWMNNTFIRGK